MDFFKEIAETDGNYKINQSGTVIQSGKTVTKGKGFYKMPEMERKATVNRMGYLVVPIWYGKNKKLKTLHRLLAETFIPNPLGLSDVNHKNGIKSDNRLENLEWCTHKQNMSHASESGLLKVGSQRTTSKLNERDVYSIVGLKRKAKMPSYILAEMFGVSQQTVCDITKGRCWTHLKGVNSI